MTPQWQDVHDPRYSTTCEDTCFYIALRERLGSGIRLALRDGTTSKRELEAVVKSCQLTDDFWQGDDDDMRTGPESAPLARSAPRKLKKIAKGFSLIELLIGMSIMAVALLSIATMFSTGYSDVHAGGTTTMAVAAARQMIEDITNLPSTPGYPFANLLTLNNTGTAATGNLPAANPERDLVRKWRYALAGDDPAAPGWAFTGPEKAQWSVMTVQGVPLRVNGQITVVQVTATLMQVTVTVQLPGRTAGPPIPVQLTTLISRL
jgi:prepilin-type N-terminal cleavage/methylation domain-containing protein